MTNILAAMFSIAFADRAASPMWRSMKGFRHVDLAEERQQMVVAIPPRNRSWEQLICFDSPASSKKGPRIQR
jgi:hypothetical protein